MRGIYWKMKLEVKDKSKNICRRASYTLVVSKAKVGKSVLLVEDGSSMTLNLKRTLVSSRNTNTATMRV